MSTQAAASHLLCRRRQKRQKYQHLQRKAEIWLFIPNIAASALERVEILDIRSST